MSFHDEFADAMREGIAEMGDQELVTIAGQQVKAVLSPFLLTAKLGIGPWAEEGELTLSVMRDEFQILPDFGAEVVVRGNRFYLHSYNKQDNNPVLIMVLTQEDQ